MSKTLHSSMPALAFAVTLFAAMFFATTAFADSVSVNFENPPYLLGTVNGQDGWSMTGPYDVAVNSSLGTAGFGAQSLRISNAVTSGSFGDWAFAKPLTNAAGESGVGAENRYEAQFDIASAVPGSEQTDLQVSVSPDDGNGSRMSYLRFEDDADGMHVIFFDVTNPGPLPTVSSFNGTDIATLNRSVPHTIKFVMDFVDGPGNDVVEIWIDGVLVHTGTSWEDYYRFDPEQTGNGNVLFAIDTLIFQARSGAGTAPGTLGNGFLFDNVELSSSTPPPPPPPPARNVNSTRISINVMNRGSIDNTTQADSHTGANTALGSVGGLGGSGGNVTSGVGGNENNGGASAGDGGDGGAGGASGFVGTGNASADAGSLNDVNSTDVEVDVGCGCGDINGLTVELDVDNDARGNVIGNLTQARGRTGDNHALGSTGGNGGNGGVVNSGSGNENNGGASAGTGGTGGTSDDGGTVVTGNANSTSGSFNLLNTTFLRVRL